MTSLSVASLKSNPNTSKLLVAKLMMQALTKVTTLMEQDVEEESSETMSTATEVSQPDQVTSLNPWVLKEPPEESFNQSSVGRFGVYPETFAEAPIVAEKPVPKPQLDKVHVSAINNCAETYYFAK